MRPLQNLYKSGPHPAATHYIRRILQRLAKIRRRASFLKKNIQIQDLRVYLILATNNRKEVYEKICS
jgi:hypothetical protein